MRENFAKARIVVFTSQAASAVLKKSPYHLELVQCDDQWLLFKLLPEIRRYRFDLALGLSQAGSFFTRFCAATLWSDFFTIDNQTGRSVVHTCMQVIQDLGINGVSIRTEFWFDDDDNRVAERFLEEKGFRGFQPLIALHCGGHYFIRKRWAPESFAALSKMLTVAGIRVVLVGGSEDTEISEAVCREVPGVFSAVGRLKLSETAALLKRCQILIGNDSGPLHLAAALGVPTIGLFGPTDPEQFYPYFSPEHTFIYKAFSCSPCFKFGGGLWQHVPRCSKAYCMSAIRPDEVMEHLENRLAVQPLFIRGDA